MTNKIIIKITDFDAIIFALDLKMPYKTLSTESVWLIYAWECLKAMD